MRYIYLVIIVLSAIMMMRRSLFYCQMNGYKIFLHGGNLREIIILLFNFIGLELLAFIFYRTHLEENISMIILISISISTALLMNVRRYKVAPSMTSRLRRLNAVFIFYNIVYLCILGVITYRITDFFVLVTIYNSILVLEYIFLFFALVVCNPLEQAHNKKYILECTERLAQYNNTKVIGITGSFAKTSVKNILTTILATTYKVKCTPASYNTPIGIAISIDKLDGDEDYFIVEMGARHVGDIEELVRIVHPSYGIITGVAEQHLSTFKTLENIEKTKYELYNGCDKLCVFNGSNDITTKMYNYSDRKKSIITHNESIYVDNVDLSIKGMSFDIHINGEIIPCETCLVGEHYIDDILMSVALAEHLGVDHYNIAKGISMLKPIPHRFEIKYTNGIYIIDDAYNANLSGVRAGLSTMSRFKGRKIVATQGIVECGKGTHAINTEIGRIMSSTTDIAILIGKNAKYIREGLESNDFNMSNVIVVSNLRHAERVFSALLRRDDILYITNDLPDNY